MIQLLKKNDSALLLFSPLLLLLVAIGKVFGALSTNTGLGAHVVRTLNLHPWVNGLIILALAISASFIFNRIVQNSVLLGRISNFPMLMITLLFAVVPMGYLAPSLWVVLLLQVFLLRYILDLPEGNNTASEAFNAGIIIGILIILEPWSMVMAWLPLQAMLSTGLLNLRRLVVHLLGVLCPLYLINATLYIIDVPMISIVPEMHLNLHAVWNSKSTLIIAAFFLFTLSMTVISVIQITSSTTLREKRKWYLMLTYLGLSVLLVVCAGFGVGVYFFLIPAAVVISRVFLIAQHMRLTNLGFLLFLMLIALFNYW